MIRILKLICSIKGKSAGMMTTFKHPICCRMLPLLLGWCLCGFHAQALPQNGTVTQGSATINDPSPVQLTINQSSANAFISWQSFNLAAGDTVTFVQPSSSSLTWNFVNTPGASSINGAINANGLVVLQNPDGITVGGSAVINTHGFILTTASTPVLNFASGGPWSFDAPPPSAKIINYGQINISGGGSAFLIADDIENNGTISAPNGNIGLYAGETVLVSTRPDGRGLSARVTLPQGSVDNEGNLIADAGSIAAQAKTVNQNGLIEANSVEDNNGTIELVASSDLNLGANSQIEANGDPSSQNPSPGGFVVLNSGGTFSDVAGSTISVTGNNAGGQGGIVEFFSNNANPGTLNSVISGEFALLVNPYDMTFSSNPTSTSDTPYSDINFNVSDLSAYSQIDLWTLDNMEVSTFWVMPAPNTAGWSLNLTAGNNITVDDQCGIGTSFGGAYDWDLNLNAGVGLPSGTTPTSGNDGIYLNGNAEIYTFSGNINLWAANEVLVNGGNIANPNDDNGGVTTLAGGNISVTAEYGDVYTGDNINGYDFGQGSAPYYVVDPYVGGISTAAGGNVNINAGGNVISYLPYELPLGEGESPAQIEAAWAAAQEDAGTGAFGPQPGNVTITAGGNVYGHYVVANGTGTITAGGNIGAAQLTQDPTTGVYLGFALSLINGNWNVFAPNGSIYVQDINNPNGLFNDTTGSGYHSFDYSPTASVLLDAGQNVVITGTDAPHQAPTVGEQGVYIPLIFPSSLTVDAGGNFTLDTSVILFPSPDQFLNLNIGDNFTGDSINPINAGLPVNLEMSDSASTSWKGLTSFGTTDHAPSPPEINNPNTVEVYVGGNMQDVNLYTTMQTMLTVLGNMQDSSFVGQNMSASDTTTIDVDGNIGYAPLYSFIALPGGITSAESAESTVWDSVFDFAVNPGAVSAIENINVDDPATKLAITAAGGLAGYLYDKGYMLFPGTSETTFAGNPGFVYDPSSQQLGYKGIMSPTLLNTMETALQNGSFTVLVTDSHGNPVTTSSGDLETTTYTLSKTGWASVIPQLYTESQNDINPSSPELGFQIGGPGQLVINAGSINLGNANGIISDGFGTYGPGSPNFASLEGICGTLDSGGASVTVNVAGDLDMINSCICSIDGGNLDVNVGGNVNLSQGSFVFPVSTCYGIWTSDHSDVSVVANGDINVGSSRIATFNGGNVFVESLNGSVDCGIGANIALDVPGIFEVNEKPTVGEFGELDNLTALLENPAPYGSGILAEFPTKAFQTPGPADPGNITVLTPNGNISSVLGGISQFALDAKIGGGPTVTLTAGTTGTAATADEGNITLGAGGVIGGTINIQATGKVQGLILSQDNANVSAGLSFVGTVLAGGSANFTGGGSISGTVVGIGGISVSGGSSVGSATLLSQNVSVPGASAVSTLGTSVATSSASQSAAQTTSSSAAQVATLTNTSQDKKKKKPTVRVGRVTVVLSTAVPR
jgi:filamentous hemagglutinin family protein